MGVGNRVSKSSSLAQSGVIVIRAISLYIARTCASNASHCSGPTAFLDAVRYSGGTPLLDRDRPLGQQLVESIRHPQAGEDGGAISTGRGHESPGDGWGA